MRHWILFISLLALLPSCRKGGGPSTDSPDEPIEKPIEVRFSSGISVSVNPEEESRAPITETFLPPGKEVGVFGILAPTSSPDDCTLESVLAFEADFQTYLDNAQYVVSSSNGDLEQQYIAQYPSKGARYWGLAFYAYYPYSDKVLPDDYADYHYQIETKLNQSHMENTEDYLYTGQKLVSIPANNESNRVELTFYHALARLHFELKSTSSEEVDVDNIIVVANCRPAGTMRIETGEVEWVKITRAPYAVYTYNVNEKLTQSSTLSADFLLYPGATIQQIQCRIGGETYSVPIDVAGITLERGAYRTIVITYSPKNVVLNEGVKLWEEKGTAIDTSIDETNKVGG